MAARLIGRNACYATTTISKRAVLGGLPPDSHARRWLAGLADARWSVTSFNPEGRRVCLTVVSPQGVQTRVALALPAVSRA